MSTADSRRLFNAFEDHCAHVNEHLSRIASYADGAIKRDKIRAFPAPRFDEREYSTDGRPLR